MPATAPTPKRLRTLVNAHKGNRAAIARALTLGGYEITRQGVSQLLTRHGLGVLADQVRSPNIRGSRNAPKVAGGKKAARARLLDTLARSPNYEAAAAALGISRRGLFRQLDRYEITRATVEARRTRLAPAPAKRAR